MSKIFGHINRAFNYRKASLAAALVLMFIGLPVIGGMASVMAQSADDGETVFTGNGCSACHSTGTNTLVGPGLAGIMDRAGTQTSLSAEDYIRQSLTDPSAFVVEGFAPIMTAFDGLSDGDVSNLIAYLGTLSGDTAVPAQISAPDDTVPVPIAAGPEGNAAQGEDLFLGSDRFEEKGPPCSACHSSSGLGALGGGTLGPDLTEAYAKLGAGMIAMPQTGTMQPIFSTRPLTDQEKADLLAFFETADASDRETQQVIQLAGLALIGVLIIALFTHLIWRKRLGSVRKTMVGR